MAKHAPRAFSFAKLTLFAVANILGGLVQIWILCVFLATQGKQYDIGLLLGDGGLFFFATSLTVSSLLVFLEQSRARRSPIDNLFTLLAIMAVLMVSVVVYTAVLGNGLDKVA